jgi:hypothetical protein
LTFKGRSRIRQASLTIVGPTNRRRCQRKEQDIVIRTSEPAAAGQTVLNGAQLDGLLTGNTAYIEVPPGGPGGPDGGIAFAYYGDDGRATFKLPTGTVLRGTWSIMDDRYCADWENGPKNSCTRVVKMPGSVLVVDAATGQTRGAIARIVPGNAERL